MDNFDCVQSSGSELSEDVSSIVCIAVEMAAGVVALFLVENAGRKTLLIISSSLAVACHGESPTSS